MTKHQERWKKFFDGPSFYGWLKQKQKEKEMKVRIQNETGEYLEFNNWKGLHNAVSKAIENDEVEEAFTIWLDKQIGIKSHMDEGLDRKISLLFKTKSISYNYFDGGDVILDKSPHEIIFTLWKEFIYDPQSS